MLISGIIIAIICFFLLYFLPLKKVIILKQVTSEYLKDRGRLGTQINYKTKKGNK